MSDLTDPDEKPDTKSTTDRHCLEILPTPMEMISYLNRFVLGQDRAKKDLATAVYNHYLGCRYGETPGARYGDFERQHILMIGPTGSGKTLMVRTLSELLKVPMSVASATSFAETGYVGDHVESLIARLLALTNWNVAAAQRGIVFVDEIDKIRREETGFRDVSGEGVQAGLLTLLDGKEITIHSGDRSAVVDVSKILFVCAGSFIDLNGVVRRRFDTSGGFGFNYTPNAHSTLSDEDLLQHIETPDLVDFGLIPELIGRFSTITALRNLSRDELVQIMTKIEGSVVAKQQVLFGIHNIDLQFAGDALEAIADEAVRLGTGARGLRRAVLRALDPVDYRLPELEVDGVRKIIISADVVCQGVEPILESSAGSIPPRLVSAMELRQDALLPKLPTGTVSTSKPLPPGITDTREWSDDRLMDRIVFLRKNLDWERTEEPARKWWSAFEKCNINRLGLVVRLMEELLIRKATITNLFSAYLSSKTDNIQANLHFMDYQMVKAQHE